VSDEDVVDEEVISGSVDRAVTAVTPVINTKLVEDVVEVLTERDAMQRRRSALCASPSTSLWHTSFRGISRK
jgi:hypothetical protein